MPTGASRRKKPRIAIEDLNARGVEAVRELRPDVIEEPDRRSGFEKAMDWIDLPRNVVARAIGGIVGLDPAQIKDRGALGLKKVFMSDVLKHLGVAEGPVRSIVGFIGDVAIDPLVYAGGPGIKTGLKAVKIFRRGARAFKAADVAVKTGGKIAPDIVEALGLRSIRGKAPEEVLSRVARYTKRTKGALTEAARQAVTKAQAELAELTAAKAGKAVIDQATKRLDDALRAAQQAPIIEAKRLGSAKFDRNLVELLLKRAADPKVGTRGLTQQAAAQAGLKKIMVPGTGVMRIPWTDIGLVLPVGKASKLYKTLGSADMMEFARTLSAQRGKKLAAMGAQAAAVGTGREAAEELARQASIVKEASEAVKVKGAAYREALSAWQAAARQGLAKGKAVKRVPVQTKELQKANRELKAAQEMLARAEDIYQKIAAVSELARKFDVSDEARRVLSQTISPAKEAEAAGVPPLSRASIRGIVSQARAEQQAALKAAPRVTEYAPEIRPVAESLKAAKDKLAAQKALAAELTPGRKAKIAEATALAEEAGGKAAEAATEARLLEYSHEAPGIMRAAREAELGPGYDPTSWQGRLQRLIGARRTQPTEMMLATKARMGTGASAMESIIFGEAQPAIDKLSVTVGQAIGKSADEARDAIYRIMDVGGAGGIQKYSALDKARQAFPADYAEIAGRPDVQEFIAKYRQLFADWWDELLREGTQTGTALRQSLPRNFTPGAAEIAANFIKKKGGRALPEGFRQGRVPARELFKGDTPVGLVLESQLDDKVVAEAIKARGLTVGEYAMPVSTLQIEDMARQGIPALGGVGDLSAAFGPDMKPFLQKGGRLFAADPASAIATRGGQQERALAMRQFQNYVGRFGVPVTDSTMGKAKARGWYAPQWKGDEVPNFLPPGLFKTAVTKPGETYFAYPVQIAEAMERFSEAFRAPTGSKVVGFWDKVMSAWKQQALWSPNYVLRNVVNNAMMIALAGGDPLDATKWSASKLAGQLYEAAARFRPELATGTVSIGGHTHTLSELTRWLARANAVGGIPSKAHFAGGVLRGEEAGRVALRGGLSQLKKALDVVRDKNALLEARMKIGAFLHYLSKGDTPQQAIERMLLAMPDLTDIPNWASGTFTRVFPWFRWTWNNGINHLTHWAVQKPFWLQVPAATKRVLEQNLIGADKVPDELRAEWQRQALGAQITGGKEAGTSFLLGSWFPQEEIRSAVASVQQPGEAARFLANQAYPPFRWMAEQATGSDIFRQKPVERQDMIDMLKAVPKALVGKSGTPLDNLLSIRPAKEIGVKVWEQPDVLSGALRFFIGGAIQPLSAERGLQESDVKIGEQLQQVRRKIIRALENKDHAEASALLRRYMSLQQQRQRLGLRVSKKTGAALQQAGLSVKPEYQYAK